LICHPKSNDKIGTTPVELQRSSSTINSPISPRSENSSPALKKMCINDSKPIKSKSKFFDECKNANAHQTTRSSSVKYLSQINANDVGFVKEPKYPFYIIKKKDPTKANKFAF
jgi:hypothetical protein